MRISEHILYVSESIGFTDNKLNLVISCFDGCNITDNVVNYDTNALINSFSDDVKFTNCHFEGNSYDNFRFGSAELENCSISD